MGHPLYQFCFFFKHKFAIIKVFKKVIQDLKEIQWYQNIKIILSSIPDTEDTRLFCDPANITLNDGSWQLGNVTGIDKEIK